MATRRHDVTKRTDGKAFDLSNSAAFDYKEFFSSYTDREKLQVSRHELSWIERYTKPDRPAKVLLNLACGAQGTPHLMLTMVAVCEALGVDFVAVAGRQFCCGRIYQRNGREESGDRMARSAIQRFASWEPETAVQLCGSCHDEFTYQVARLEEDAGDACFHVTYVNDFLLQELERLADDVPWRRATKHRVLLHTIGEGLAGPRVLPVLEILDRIPGVEVVGEILPPSLGDPAVTEYPGGPSILNDVSPPQYRRIQAELQAQADEVDADAIVTYHHMPQREWSKFASDRLPVVNYLSLLADALGVCVPDRFQMLWRLGDPEKVLDRSRPQWESWGIDEQEARGLVRKYFMPKYAPAVPHCPCEGHCTELIRGACRIA